MAEGVFRTGRAVLGPGSTSEAGAEAKSGTQDGTGQHHPPATSGVLKLIGDMPFTIFMLYFLLLVHVLLMGGWLVYKYV